MTLVHFAFASALAFFAPTRTSLLGQPVRPRSALLLQLDDSAPATNEEVRMARMYKPGDEKDPLKKPRPKFGLAPATGRPTEKVCAADMPTTADLPEWAEHLRESGVERLLFVHEGAADDEHVALLMLQGFAADAVTAVDVSAEGAAQQTMAAMQAAATAGTKICVHGGPFTLVLAQWVLTDYIGSENCEEACETLRARKRFGGVDWAADPKQVELFLGLGDGDAAPPSSPPPPPSPTGPTKVSPGGILLG